MLCSVIYRYASYISIQKIGKNRCLMLEQEGKSSENDSIKFKISSKTPRGKKDSTKRHHHGHHKRQPGEQQFPKLVVTG